MRLEDCIKDENGYIVAWCVGYTEEEIAKLLIDHPNWYRTKEEI